MEIVHTEIVPMVQALTGVVLMGVVHTVQVLTAAIHTVQILMVAIHTVQIHTVVATHTAIHTVSLLSNKMRSRRMTQDLTCLNGYSVLCNTGTCLYLV